MDYNPKNNINFWIRKKYIFSEKNMITRTLQSVIEHHMFKGKVIIVLGPRQVGKTTLMEQIGANLLSLTLFFQ